MFYRISHDFGNSRNLLDILQSDRISPVFCNSINQLSRHFLLHRGFIRPLNRQFSVHRNETPACHGRFAERREFQRDDARDHGNGRMPLNGEGRVFQGKKWNSRNLPCFWIEGQIPRENGGNVEKVVIGVGARNQPHFLQDGEFQVLDERFVPVVLNDARTGHHCT